PPASEAEVADVEARLGRAIPRELRRVFIDQARSFSFAWERQHFDLLPHPWKHAHEGRCLWSLDLLPGLNADLAKISQPIAVVAFGDGTTLLVGGADVAAWPTRP